MTSVPLPQRGTDWKEILVCSAGAASAAAPPNTQPHHEEITALHLMHYQKISTCNEAGLTMTFYKASWEECFVIK